MSDPQKTQQINFFMTITVKVQFRDKLYKLAQGTTNLQQVQKQMKQRFPTLDSLKYYYQDVQVRDLSAIMTSAATEGSSSVRLIAKKNYFDISQLNETSEVVKSEINESSNISMLVEQDKKEYSKAKVALPNQFYLCYNCQGAKTIKSMSFLEICPICKGVGQLEQTHKYVNRLRYLYLKHFKPIQRAEKVLKDFEEQHNPRRKSSFTGVDKNYEVIVRQISKREQIEIGTIFSMRFQIKNIGPNWEKKCIEVIQMGQIQGKTLSALKTGQIIQIELGPFICNTEGVLEKTYTLCYRQGESLVRFGHKFGFSIKGFKPKGAKKMVSNQRERIRDLKMISGSSKSEQYISLKLKSMGIDMMNLQLQDQVLVDMIKQFK